MDAHCLSEHVKHLAAAGSVTLNIEERMRLELALDKLCGAIEFEQIQLWGKIQGKNHETKFLKLFCFV